MLSYVKISLVKLYLARLGQVRSGQVRSGQVRSGKSGKSTKIPNMCHFGEYLHLPNSLNLPNL